ncbi:MAG: hypothetical protein WD670_02585 [Actinomycetota bacterium]
MGEVIDLDAWRRVRRHRGAGDPLSRLEAAIERVERLLGPRRHDVSGGVERELAAITRAVGDHRVEAAIERAERLADRLEHPTAGAGL